MNPVLKFDLDRLILNCNTFKRSTSNEFRNKTVKIFYAVKANADNQVTSTIFNEGIGAEVLALRELTSIPEHVDVVVNGHCKSKELIEASIKRRNCLLIIEGFRELELVKEFLERDTDIQARIGLRIAVSDGSRIGFQLEDLNEICEAMINEPRIALNTLHFHAGWNIKDVDVVRSILKRMKDVHEFLRSKGIHISCWNFGGSFAEPLSFPEQLQARLRIYRESLPDEILEVIFEPGRYLVGDCGRLEAEVVEVRKGQIILNAATYGYLLSGATPRMKYINANETIEQDLLLSEDTEDNTLISGVWPSENDYLKVTYQSRPFNPGDRIVFENMGAYLVSSFRSLSHEDLLSYRYEGTFLPLWKQANASQKVILLKFWNFNKKKFNSLPKRLNELRMMLDLIVSVFDVNKTYPEKELNSILLNYHNDFCTLRRDLVEQNLLNRSGGSQVFYERVI